MTGSNSSDVKVYECPSPDCNFTAGGSAELLEHVNTEHPGEYRRDDWPDTESGRESREVVEVGDKDEE